jgi:hypothetical protein
MTAATTRTPRLTRSFQKSLEAYRAGRYDELIAERDCLLAEKAIAVSALQWIRDHSATSDDKAPNHVAVEALAKLEAASS